MPTLYFPFNVLLTDDDRNRLTALARAKGSSRSQCIRHAITASYLMVCRGVPFCADHSRCKAPQLFGDDLQPISQELLTPTPQEPTK